MASWPGCRCFSLSSREGHGTSSPMPMPMRHLPRISIAWYEIQKDWKTAEIFEAPMLYLFSWFIFDNQCISSSTWYIDCMQLHHIMIPLCAHMCYDESSWSLSLTDSRTRQWSHGPEHESGYIYIHDTTQGTVSYSWSWCPRILENEGFYCIIPGDRLSSWQCQHGRLNNHRLPW